MDCLPHWMCLCWNVVTRAEEERIFPDQNENFVRICLPVRQMGQEKWIHCNQYYRIVLMTATHIHVHLYMLCTKFRLGQSSDCPAQSSDPSIARAIPGLSETKSSPTHIPMLCMCKYVQSFAHVYTLVYVHVYCRAVAPTTACTAMVV